MALTDAIGAVIGGLLSKGPVSAPDLTQLFQTIDQAGSQQKDWINALLPSQSPTMIGMTYKGRTYAPLVIESIGYPISSPINSEGHFVEMTVRMMLCSLAAIDRGDWLQMKSGNFS